MDGKDVQPVHGVRPRGKQLKRSLRYLTVAWIFGAVWLAATSGAPLTLFAQGLGASEFQFGLLSAIPFLTSLISLPASWLIDQTGSRKNVFFIGLYFQRLAWVPIAMMPQALLHHSGGGPGSAAVWWFLFLTLLMFCGQAFGTPAWVSWMADLVPDRSRGKYFGMRRGWGMAVTVPTAVVVGLVLDHVAATSGTNSEQMLRVCGWVFIVAAGFGAMDIAFHHPIPEIRAAPVKVKHLMSGFMRPLRDPQFLWFAGFVGTITFAVSFMGQFVTLFMIDKLKVTNTGTQLMLIAVPAVAQLLVLQPWGHAVDRYGKKPVLTLASLGLVPIGFGWCFMNGGAIWLGYILTAVGAALYCGVEVANLNITLEMSGADDNAGTAGSSYVAVNSIIVNIFGCIGGVSAGLIAQALRGWSWDSGIPGLAPIGSYEVLFALSGVSRLLAVILFLPKIHEPDSKPAHETLRFMTSNIYNNLYNAIAVPWKSFRERE